MTTHKLLGALASLITMVGLIIAWSIAIPQPAAGSQAIPMPVETAINPDQPRRELQGNPDSPAISFIDNPSATCYRPATGTGICYINWNSISVQASASSYIISMTVAIGGNLRAYHSGFFQTSMNIPGDMYGPGFQVACGGAGSGGISGFGNTYSYTIRASETGGLSATNYGSVTCPVGVPDISLPLILRR